MSEQTRNEKILEYLRSRNIYYRTEGKSTSRGWININCYFHAGDTDQRLGISNNGFYHCWSCNAKGWFSDIIKIVDGLDEREARITHKSLTGEYSVVDYTPKYNPNFKLPGYITDEPLNIQRDYLKVRGFNVDQLITEFGLKFGSRHTPKFPFRVIIPVTYNRQIVTFQAMDVIRKGNTPPYLSPPLEETGRNIKHCLYNFDKSLLSLHQNKGKIILVEGVTGVWKIVRSTVALLGKKWTDEQVELLSHKNIKEIWIYFDPEKQAQEDAKELAEILDSIGKKARVLNPDFGGKDSGALNVNQIYEIKQEVFS